MRTFKKYKQNLKVVTTPNGDYVQSYSTHVAKIDYATKELHVLGYWSMTTSKHINYAAQQLGLTIVKQ